MKRRGSKTASCLAVACWAGILVSCATLPDYGPQVQERGARAVRLASAHGRLSAAQSAAILARLDREGKSGDLLARHTAIEESVAGGPMVTGNKVELLEDGPATYRSMFAAMREAKSNIDFETYIFRDDEVGHQFADLMLSKQAQGVQVNLIYDSVGSLKTPREFFERLKSAGVRVLEFNPANPLWARRGWALNHRDHRKLLVVDGRVAFVGGINVADTYASGSSLGGRTTEEQKESGWRDMHARIEGPVAGEFQKLFLETWEKQNGEPLLGQGYFPEPRKAGDALVRAVGSAADDPHSLIYETLLAAVANAQKTVHVTVAYFIPDRQIVEVLREAASRGVDVTLILPGATDSWTVFHAGRSHYTELLEAGVKIYERGGALLHSKAVVVDGVWSSIGSTNWDPRSFIHNDEINAVVLGGDFGGAMEKAFQKDLRQSKPVELAQWRRRSPLLRLEELSARAWEYWL